MLLRWHGSLGSDSIRLRGQLGQGRIWDRLCGVRNTNSCNEAISLLRKCLYIPGHGSGIAQCFTDSTDAVIQTAVEIDISVLGPQGEAQIFAADELARSLNENYQ